MLSYYCFSVFQRSKIIIRKSAIFCKCSHKKRIFQGAKVVDESGCKVLERRQKREDGDGVKSKRQGIWCKHPVFKKEKKNKKKKNKNFVSCVMVCDVIRFDLRHFLGFLVGFCVLCGKLSRLR